MNQLPIKVFRLTGGMIDVVAVSQQKENGVWAVSVLQRLPDWGFRVAELTPVNSQDCVPKVLEAFQRWAGGQIHEVELLSPNANRASVNAACESKLDSGWVRLKDRHFFRMLDLS